MNRSIAILGAGPIGLEAATLAQKLGWDFTVYEAGHVADSVKQWGHVRFFSPWALNVSPWQTVLDISERADQFPTGAEFRAQYLMPLAERLGDRLKLGHRILGISHRDVLKGHHIGSRGESGPFLLHLSTPSGEEFVEADIVVDATGVYQNPASMGPGGLNALGETQAGSRIWRQLPDVLGADRGAFEGKEVLLVGAGHSAVTTLRALSELSGTEVFWSYLGDQAPYQIIEDDPLPQRDALSRFGNTAAAGGVKGITPKPARAVESIRATSDGGFEVELRGLDSSETLKVDQIVSHVGYKPDLSITRELQVHYCYASDGPMKLAATLLSSAGGDCLTQSSSGVQSLMSPETNYWVLGTKSYGRNSSFLLKIGIAQIEEVFTHLQG